MSNPEEATENRGGRRKGAGRPKGSVRADAQVSYGVGMPATAWAELDRQRGAESRGSYIARRLGLITVDPVNDVAGEMFEKQKGK